MKVLFIHRNDGTDMRVSKECNSLLAAGHDVLFVGWKGDDTQDMPDPMPLVKKRFFTPPGNARSLRYLPGFVAHIFSTLKQSRPDVVQCVNEDLAYLTLLLKPFLGYKVICDVFDSLALRKGGAQFPLGELARAVTYVAHAGSDVILVTDETRHARLGKFSKKAFIVGNFPVDIGEDVARSGPSDDGSVKLYVAGTLYADRGLDAVQKLLQRHSDVRVISAGWLLDDAAHEFVKHPHVEYNGVLLPAESLRLAARCHAIVALYAPTEENNILASPNKIYDALCIGRPIIINREARVSDWIMTNKIGYVMPYGDVDRFSEIIDELAIEMQNIERVVKHMRGLFNQGYGWNIAERNLLAAYSDLG